MIVGISILKVVFVLAYYYTIWVNAFRLCVIGGEGTLLMIFKESGIVYDVLYV